MPDQSSNMTALRGAHSARAYLSILADSEPIVTASTTAAADTSGEIDLAISISDGSETDIKRGMRVVIETSGGSYKGTLSVRSAGTISSTNLPVREFASGSVTVASGDTVKVYRDFVLSDKLVAASEGFEPDHETYTDQTDTPAPLVCSGGWDAGWTDVGETFRTIPTYGADTIAVDPDGGTLVHTWTLLTSGIAFASGSGASDASPTLEADPGYHVVQHDVENTDTGKIETQYVCYRVHDTTNAPLECVVNSFDIDAKTGARASVQVFDDADITAIPDNAWVILWVDEMISGANASYGSAVSGRSHIVILGILRRDTSSLDNDGAETLEFEIISPLARLAELPGFSKVMSNSDAPTDWSGIRELGVWRGIVQIARHYTNATNLLDLLNVGIEDREYPALYLQKSTPYDQVVELAGAIDCRFVCDRAGRLEVQRRLELTPISERGTPVTTFTLTSEDVIEWEVSREHWNPVETFRARGFIRGYTDNTPVFARFPATPGRGNQSGVIDKLIVDSAADMYKRCALRGAWEQRVYFDSSNVQHHAPEMRLTLFGAYAQSMQPYREWIAFSGITTPRGIALSTFRWMLVSASVAYDEGTAATTVVLQAETSAGSTTAADDAPTSEVTPPAYDPPQTPPIAPPTIPGTTSYTVNKLGLFCANGIAKTTNFQSASPTYTYTSWASLSVTGTFLQWVPDGYNFGSGWVITSTKVYYGSLVTLSFTLKHTFSDTTIYRSADASFGVANHFVVASYIETVGTKVLRTTDNSTFTEITDTTHYNTSSLSIFPGCYVSPRTAGKVIISSFSSTGSPASKGRISTDYGASFSDYSGFTFATSIALAEHIHVPYFDNAAESVVYYAAIPSAGDHHVYKNTTDVTPSVSGEGIAPRFGRDTITTSVANRQRVIVCGQLETANTYAVALSNDGGSSWTTIAAAGSNYRRCAIAGDNPNVGWLWGTSNAIAQLAISGNTVTEYDKIGNLAGLSAGEIVAIGGY